MNFIQIDDPRGRPKKLLNLECVCLITETRAGFWSQGVGCRIDTTDGNSYWTKATFDELVKMLERRKAG